MNPPPFIKLDSEFLGVLERALTKYIADDNYSNPQIKEIAISMLLGEQWVSCTELSNWAGEGRVGSALYDLLPLHVETLTNKPNREREKWHDVVKDLLLKYLNETSKKPEH